MWEYNETDTSQTLQIYADIRPNEPSANPSYLTVFNGKLYFSADNGEKGDEIWSLAPCLNIFVTTISESEEGAGDGSIDLTVEGGTPPYTFQWSNGSTAEDPSGLPGGDYGVTVTDDLGCIAQLAAVVLTATGVGELGFNEGLRVFPNPSDGLVIVEFESRGPAYMPAGRQGAGELRVVSSLGMWSGGKTFLLEKGRRYWI
ncbi:MAG: SprB repeat-containing protein [Saprospirales bacterium]|nr:SprB repeat-containing protein [Saprospirales bacterium]